MWNKKALSAALSLMVLLGTYRYSAAQNAAAAKPPVPPDKTQVAYRLDFLLSELEDGKKINTRQYSMNAKSGDSAGNEIKIGTRVPVEVKEREMQYLDVGTNIWCRLRDDSDNPSVGGNVALNIRAEVSSIVPPEPGRGESSTPPVRQVRIEAGTIMAPGKSAVVGVVDDPNSKRQYQLEVTVTKLR